MRRPPIPHAFIMLALLGAFISGLLASSHAVEITAALRADEPSRAKDVREARTPQARRGSRMTAAQRKAEKARVAAERARVESEKTRAAAAARRADEARRKVEEARRRAAAEAARRAAILARVSRHGLSWPHVAPMTSGYGHRRRGFHHGIDLLCGPKGGEPIRAANRGRVVAAGMMPVYGRAVIIQHPNNMRTLYGHFSAITVKLGSSVKRGQVIGRCGSSGRSTAPHLHFEVYSWGRIINPLRALPSNR